MIGLDTNVLIRYLTQDEPKQSAKANTLIESTLSEKHLGFISLIVLIEISWVLESCYDQDQQSIINVIKQLLTTKQFVIQHADIAHLAIKTLEKHSGDFSDAVIALLAKQYGCNKTVTFDRKAIRTGMTLL
ncbi:MAG: type II toxin-antitoxin system VapC family toxin [Cellvibrionales bacterium]|nr:type II toxin-antitoxin system VapC family toxin [Cellvibrionales bacterium]